MSRRPRQIAQGDAAFLPDLASALNNLGIRYSEVGRRQDALAPTEEAVQLHRELAAANPAFLPDLARALNNLGSLLQRGGAAPGRPGPHRGSRPAATGSWPQPTPPSCPTSPAR